MNRTGAVLRLLLSCSLFTTALTAAKLNDECRTTDSMNGTCMPLRQCQRLFDLFSKPRPLPAATTQLLRAERCGTQGRKPLVCCRNEADLTRAVKTRFLSNSPGSPIDVSTHPNVGLVNPEFCGQISAKRVLNGEQTGVFEMPWMALIKARIHDGRKYRESFVCGGSLINKRYVLTAAHCLSNVSSFRVVSVRLGDHDTSTDEDCEDDGGVRVCAPPPQNINVESFVRHPGFTGTSLKDDIGLIRLAEPADVDRRTIEPLCLPVGLAEQDKNLDRMNLTVAGWGLTEKDVGSPHLLKARLPVVPTLECQAVLKDYNVTITGALICAGGTKLRQDSCDGDSGGPLISYGTVNEDEGMVQYGVVSVGLKECATEGIPALYTRVGHYMDWILNTIEPF